MTTNVNRGTVGTTDEGADLAVSAAGDNVPTPTRQAMPAGVDAKEIERFRLMLAACGIKTARTAEEQAKEIAAEWDELDVHYRTGWKI